MAQPTPPGSQSPQGQEIVLNLNHGVAPVVPPPAAGPMQPEPTTMPPVQPQPMAAAPQQPYPQAMPGQPIYGAMAEQPGVQWQTGPVPQTPYPTGMMPPTTPATMIGQPPAGDDENTGSSKKLLYIAIAIVVVAILIGGGAYALVALGGKKPAKTTSNTTNQSCADPTTGSTVSKQNAEVTFVRVATAIKQKNQTCVTSLSSAYFTQVQNEVYPGSNGQWITKSASNLPSLATRLANIPGSFTVSQFSSSAYTRAVTTGSDGKPIGSTTNLPGGLTLSYPITDASTKAKAFLEISFISSNNKVAVDYLKIVPDTTKTSSSSSTESPASQNADAIAANQELAQEDIISIDAYLTAYRGNLNSYPNTLDAATFISAGIGVDTSTFTPPAGTSFVYTPGPSGCTTAAKNCISFTLAAVDTSSNATIYSMNGSTNSN